MSKKLRISDAMRITGLKRHRITEMRERKVIIPERESWGYGYTDELIGLLSMYSGLKDDIKMPYSTIKTLNKFLEESPSFTERIQEIYRVFQNYDCTENYIASKKYFYIYCSSVLELDDEFEELLEEIISEKIVYPENETLKSMYNYYLYKANVIDVYRDLYNIEHEFESEFWSLDVVKGFDDYIFNIVLDKPLITERIDEHLMCILMKVQYNSESKNNPLIKKLTLLLKKINKFHDETNNDYDTCQHIFLHAIMLLSFNIFDNQKLITLWKD
ncbi:Uncharacterised protein [Niallia circulans]|uniref:hypothetical protein n=1 Tax=Niallia circulans TaxID=1397 RepID=UPI00077C476D|nr:hypothetical protein [Niallia circulans]MDR4318651.1 hypothetical protein [Niallia circulans]MED3839389.1 hypothetical protein [Niallia circulans]MED4245372.1 hypothetical protein [Niallia circulans]MED4250907.1 hypothetical protein [Niallia circulans]QKH60184.1 hypothetical protein FOC77_05720 [Niallia circulans]